MRFELADGGELPLDGEPGVIYLKENDDDPPTYGMYTYIGDEWLCLGSTQIDLSGYWSTDELVIMSNSDIQGIIDEVTGGEEEPGEEEPEEP